MPDPTAISADDTPGAAQYRALLDHCQTCRACRRNTAVACPVASRLRRAWSEERRSRSETR